MCDSFVSPLLELCQIKTKVQPDSTFDSRQLAVRCSLANMWKGNPYGAGWREGPVESWFGSAPAGHIEMF